MSDSDPTGDRVSELAERAGRQDGAALAELMPLVYDELRRLARGYLGRERRAYTLQPTALVNEAYLRCSRTGSRTGGRARTSSASPPWRCGRF